MPRKIDLTGQVFGDLIFSDTLESRRKKDLRKNKYCIDNNILLYRIPYWEKNNINKLEDIIQNKFLVKGKENINGSI